MLKSKEDMPTIGITKTNSIVDSILGSEYKAELYKNNQIPEGIEPLFIKPADFFVDNGRGGYVSAKEFIEHIRLLSENERVSFNALLELMTGNYKINSPNFEKLYKGRRAMFFINKQKFGDRELMVYTTGNMKTFVGLYQMDLLKCDLNLESLCKEAVHLTSQV